MQHLWKLKNQKNSSSRKVEKKKYFAYTLYLNYSYFKFFGLSAENEEQPFHSNTTYLPYKLIIY